MNSFASFARYDQSTALWRTRQACLLPGLDGFSGDWPKAGMMRNGIAFRLPRLVPRTSVIESSLLPTLTVPNGGRQPKGGMNLKGKRPDGRKSQVDLKYALRFLPTLQASAGERGGSGDLYAVIRGTPNKHSGFLPTLKARDFRSGSKRCSKRAELKASGEWHSPDLNDVLAPGGQLNPTWCEWYMGFPSGWTELDASEIASCRNAHNGSAKG